MTNAIALKIGQQLEIQYTNTIIPVDLIINGTLRVNYTLTQQVQVNENRINIGENGYLLELDINFDEENQFKSNILNLPVMVKALDIDDIVQLDIIKNRFQQLENRLFDTDFPNNNYGNYIDKRQLTKHLIVNNLTANFEINHPKSVYMYAVENSKFMMGPIWDFDWGFGLDENTRKYFNFTNVPLLKEEDDRLAAKFFSQFMKDPEIKSLYKSIWKNYRCNNFVHLLDYIEKHASSIRESQKKDFELWNVGDNNLPKAKADMKTYLKKRATYIDKYVSTL